MFCGDSLSSGAMTSPSEYMTCVEQGIGDLVIKILNFDEYFNKKEIMIQYLATF